MVNARLKEHSRDAAPATRILAAQAFSRAAGAPLVRGNGIRLLKDASENYPAWLEAIRLAERTIHFENYIIRDDDVGEKFAAALIAKAREGVRVRLLYDWMGALTQTSGGFWRRLGDGGVDVRCFNPPSFDSPLGWLSRLHRKSLSVDNRVSYIGGLCVGQMWTGYPERNIPPWRDTGIEVRGPVVADVVQSFSRAWAETGPDLPADELPTRDSVPVAGIVDIRVMGDSAANTGLYRLEQLIAVLAQKTLWLTDAYFVGTPSYVQALCGAATDGVDVRLLVPGSSGDLKFLRPISRSGYRVLLEAGVRVFEWNGSMLHAKSAVVDGRWSRVGSSNLNIASWLGNWELDVAVENLGFAQEMEQMYLQDLDSATEIVLSGKNRVRPVTEPGFNASSAAPALSGARGRTGGSASRLTAGALRVGNTVGGAITSRLVLGAAEAKIMLFGGAALLVLALLALFQPLLMVVPFSLIAGWIGLSLVIKGCHLRGNGKSTTSPSHPASGKTASGKTDDTSEVSHDKGERGILLSRNRKRQPKESRQPRDPPNDSPPKA